MMTMTRNNTGGADADLTLRDHLDLDLTLLDPDLILLGLLNLLGLDRDHRGHRDREGVLDVEEEARVPAEVPGELEEPAELEELGEPAELAVLAAALVQLL